MATLAVYAFSKKGLHILDPTFSVDRFPSPLSEKVLLSRVSGAAINRASEEAATGAQSACTRCKDERAERGLEPRRAAGGGLGQEMYRT